MTSDKKSFGAAFWSLIKVSIVLVLFAFYVSLEAQINVALIKLYSLPLQDIFGEYRDVAHHIEFIGRIVTGFGLSLAFVSLLPWHKITRPEIKPKTKPTSDEATPSPQQEEDAALPSRHTVNWLLRPTAILLFWLMAIPSLHVVVEFAVHCSDDQTKLSALRSVVFKESLQRDMLRFEGSELMDTLAADPDKRELLVAMLPSLSLFAPSVRAIIADRTDAMAVQFIENRQQQGFEQEALAIIKQVRQGYNQEWQQYQSAQQEAQQHFLTTSSFAKRKQLADQLQYQASQVLDRHWKNYANGYENSFDDIEPLANTFYDDFKKYRKRALNDDCIRYDPCFEGVNREFSKWMEGAGKLLERDGKTFGLKFEQDHQWFYKNYIGGKKNNFRAYLSEGRELYLASLYPFDDDLDRDEFLQQPSVRAKAVEFIRQQDLDVDDSWSLNNPQQLLGALVQRSDRRVEQVWEVYQKKSKFKETNRTLSKISFAKLPQARSFFAATLGKYYTPSYEIYHNSNQIYDAWQATLNNANFVKMLTDAAAQTAFAPGGTFYQLGLDAVQFSAVPPISIVLSFIAILVLAVKLYLFLRSEVPKLSVLFLCGLTLFMGYTFYTALNHPTAYWKVMREFSTQTVQANRIEQASAVALGGFLDLEAKLLSSVSFNIRSLNQLAEEPNGNEFHRAYLHAKTVDQWVYQRLPLDWILPSEQGYDFNFSVYKRDERLGFYAGLQFDGDKLESVSIPNVMRSAELGFLLEQRWFLAPNYQDLLVTFADNARDPEHWLDVTQYGRVSLLEKLEQQTEKWLQQENNPYKRRIDSARALGQTNLLLIQQGKKSRYDCYQLPVLTISNLVEMVNGQQVSNAEQYRCNEEIL